MFNPKRVPCRPQQKTIWQGTLLIGTGVINLLIRTPITPFITGRSPSCSESGTLDLGLQGVDSPNSSLPATFTARPRHTSKTTFNPKVCASCTSSRNNSLAVSTSLTESRSWCKTKFQQERKSVYIIYIYIYKYEYIYI